MIDVFRTEADSLTACFRNWLGAVVPSLVCLICSVLPELVSIGPPSTALLIADAVVDARPETDASGMATGSLSASSSPALASKAESFFTTAIMFIMARAASADIP